MVAIVAREVDWARFFFDCKATRDTVDEEEVSMSMVRFRRTGVGVCCGESGAVVKPQEQVASVK